MANNPFRIQGMGIRAEAQRRYWKRWKGIGEKWTDLDRIMLTEPQVVAMAEEVIETEYFSSDTLKRPSIPEFTVIVGEAGKQENTYICFRKTLMNADDFIVPFVEGAESTIVPFIDAYCYVNNKGTLCNCVVTLCATTLKNTATGEVLTCSGQAASYYNDDPDTDRMFSDMDYFNEFARTVKALYMAVQRISGKRPEVLVTTGTTEVEKTVTIKRKGRYKQVRKTKMVKVIRVSDDVIVRQDPRGHHKISCPCWGVAGHMRTYKSGKQVWIKPYRKGKQRNNPAAYVPKEYQLPKEE